MLRTRFFAILLIPVTARCGGLIASYPALTRNKETPRLETTERPAAMDAVSSVSTVGYDDYGRWLCEMKQEYARRLLMAADRDYGFGSGRRSAAKESTGEVFGNPVYRSIELCGSAGKSIGGHKAALLHGRQSSGRRSSRSAIQWVANAEEVDEEWKMSCPPLLQRQAAFTR